MNNAVKKNKVTIMLDTAVYEGLRSKVGARGIGEYISNLARPYVVEDSLEDGYKAMAQDEKRQEDANKWSEDTLYAPRTENVWRV